MGMVIGAGQNTGLPRLFRVNGHPGKAVVDDRRRCAGVVASRDGLTNGGYVNQVPTAALGRERNFYEVSESSPWRVAPLDAKDSLLARQRTHAVGHELPVAKVGCPAGPPKRDYGPSSGPHTPAPLRPSLSAHPHICMPRSSCTSACRSPPCSKRVARCRPNCRASAVRASPR